MKFVFITDLHITGVCNVRYGDPTEDIRQKLAFVVDYCNENDAQLLIGGDLFDKSIVSDSVKSAIAPEFIRLKHRAISINGNHDRMYDNDDFEYKTSYNVFTSHGVITDITNAEIQFGNVVVTNKLPIADRGLNQIVIFHGFLNLEDGRNTFHTSDLTVKTDKVRVFLGHDHTVHEPIVVGNAEIHRIGSFFRMDRTEESNRIPQMAVIDGDTMEVTYLPITASRSADDVFKVRLDTAKEETKCVLTYESLMRHLSGNTQEESTLIEALRQVTDDDTIRYIEMLMAEHNQTIK